MTLGAPRDPPAEPEPDHGASAGGERRDEAGAAVYRLLTGNAPGEADIEGEQAFDAHVLASILAAAAMDGGSIRASAGLDPEEAARLIERRFPRARRALNLAGAAGPNPDEAEIAMVRDLLSRNRSTGGDEGRWLAAMVARRALEPNHLWEDLGLRDRGELSRLLLRHFAPLAERNTRGMRWKRFFYRVLCEADGFVMCATPVCTDCRDFDHCFGEESGESRLARRRRRDMAPDGGGVLAQ